MKIFDAIEIIEGVKNSKQIEDFGFWVQFGQAIEIIKQYANENEKVIVEEKVEEINIDERRDSDFLSSISKLLEEREEPIKIFRSTHLAALKPIINHYGMVDGFKCPKCGSSLKSYKKTCTTCGIELDWRDYTPPGEVQVGYKGTKTNLK